jgi:excisionase family DNA binding protein
MRHSGQDRERQELLTVEEAARYLRVTRRTLDRWRASGIGPRSIKLPSGGRRYRCEDLDAYLAEHRDED